ncbi:MAG: Fe(2+) transporter permease subunit FeoB [Rhodospirillales bacterium]|nr:Fe(2+) transporter permease subunit FeoB [Rhodospirillales bacterium]
MASHTICLVGNPNCGKTTLFNALTGARQQVGNWPGVTVERKTGTYRFDGQDVCVVDLPGVYSVAVTSVASLDERVAREYVLSNEAQVVVNILDASNLERNLYLTTQLLEMRAPMVVALNMLDVARDRRITIDVDALAKYLGCPVVPLVANRGEGLDVLRKEIRRLAGSPHGAGAEIRYGDEVEQVIEDLLPTLKDLNPQPNAPDLRWLAVKLLEGDEAAKSLVPPQVSAKAMDLAEAVYQRVDEDCDILIADSRYGFANAVIKTAVHRQGVIKRTMSDRIDKVVMHRLAGIPIFLVVMYLLFFFTINVGSAFIDVFEQLTGVIFVSGGSVLLESLGSPQWLTALVADGIGGGIQTVATFIPIIACLYLFLSFLEDSGYMARAAFVMDRFMRAVGLPGKSFIPLIVGFGCNVPAIMATRTLENRRDRVLTVMMAPFMSCGARLPVYALFAAAMFPTGGQNLVFALYMIGIGFAVLTGVVLKGTLLRGEASPFVMELPPYHLPTLRSVLWRTWERLKEFTYRAGRVIIAVVVVLSFFNSFGTDGTFGNQDTDNSVLAAAGKVVTPVLAPMGISEDNWPATVGMVTGILAKEVVVGTLNSLYASLADEKHGGMEGEADAGFDLWGGITAAFATIPENLIGLADSVMDPLGFSIVQSQDLESAAEAQDVDVGLFGEMASRFDGRIGAFAYLLAILLYMPCAAALAAIWRETGPAWALFAASWTTGLGYGAAVLAYQAGTFERDPVQAAGWIAGIIIVFAAALMVFRIAGGRGVGRMAATAVAAE